MIQAPITMTQYGAGAPGFGMLSVVFLTTLLTFLAAAACIAHFPAMFVALGRWLSGKSRERPLVRRAGRHVGRRVDMLATKLSVDVAAAASLLTGVIIVALLSAAFAELLDNVLEGQLIELIDQPVAQWAASHRDLWLTSVMKLLTYAGKGVTLSAIVTVVSVTVAWCIRSWLPVILGAVGLGGVGLAVLVTKTIIGRDRPPTMYALTVEHGYSFPSGHSTGSTATAVLCAWMLTFWLIKGWTARVAVWTFALVSAGVIGFSRIYLGVHYFTDVLAGAALGAAWAGAVTLVGAWWDHSRRFAAGAESGASAQPTPALGGGMQGQAQAGGGQHRDAVDRPGNRGPSDEDTSEGQ